MKAGASKPGADDVAGEQHTVIVETEVWEMTSEGAERRWVSEARILARMVGLSVGREGRA